MSRPTLTVGKEVFTLEEVGQLVRLLRDSAGGEILRRVLSATKGALMENLVTDMDERDTQRTRGGYKAIEAFEAEIGVNLSVWYDSVIDQIQKTSKE